MAKGPGDPHPLGGGGRAHLSVLLQPGVGRAESVVGSATLGVEPADDRRCGDIEDSASGFDPLDENVACSIEAIDLHVRELVDGRAERVDHGDQVS